MAKRKPTTYNLILKQFTKLNNKLPEENKLSIKLRREIIKKVLLPQFKGVPQYKIKLKSLKGLIINEIEKVPPKEICDLNYIDPSEFAFVEWYALSDPILFDSQEAAAQHAKQYAEAVVEVYQSVHR